MEHGRSIAWVIVLAALLCAGAVWARGGIRLEALSSDKAIFVIDGTRRVLAVGETSPEGVTLLHTDPRAEQARIRFQGRRQVIALDEVMSSFKPRGKAGVTLFAAPNGSFYADGAINGIPVRFLVDTGATTIAMNSAVAARLGLDYKQDGHRGLAVTASGVTVVYGVWLDHVSVGDITLYNVPAVVRDGRFPTTVLLGMSYLGQLDMKREGDRLDLRQAY